MTYLLIALGNLMILGGSISMGCGMRQAQYTANTKGVHYFFGGFIVLVIGLSIVMGELHD